MIFITVGSQKFQFNRLLQYIDHLVAEHGLHEPIFAQTGYSDYRPKNYEYKDFLNREEFNKKIMDCQLIITHGGTGAIMGAVKAGKKVIAVPRLSRFGEHVDDHQEQIVKQLLSKKLIIGVNHLEELEEAIRQSSTFQLETYKSNTKTLIESIDNYISEVAK